MNIRAIKVSRKLLFVSIISASTLILLVVGTSANFSHSDETAHAEVDLPYDQLDIGLVDAGPILTAEFPITNTGNRRLFIRQKSVSCECGSDGDLVTLLPGESSIIKIQLETQHLDGQFEIEWEYSTSSKYMPKFTLRAFLSVVASDATIQDLAK
jgi:hypothetical protein